MPEKLLEKAIQLRPKTAVLAQEAEEIKSTFNAIQTKAVNLTRYPQGENFGNWLERIFESHRILQSDIAVGKDKVTVFIHTLKPIFSRSNLISISIEGLKDSLITNGEIGWVCHLKPLSDQSVYQHHIEKLDEAKDWLEVVKAVEKHYS